MSHPSWVCGLKQEPTKDGMQRTPVTPFVGVWIETENRVWRVFPRDVTPFVGVWIETDDEEE